jgi:hypothetical protein
VCFATEAGAPVRIICERRADDHDGHVAVQLGVASPIDLAHPARAQLGHDFVRTERSRDLLGRPFQLPETAAFSGTDLT